VSEDVSESDNSCHFYSVFCSVLQSARTGVGPRPDQTRQTHQRTRGPRSYLLLHEWVEDNREEKRRDEKRFREEKRKA
jgi:hypothetical protein